MNKFIAWKDASGNIDNDAAAAFDDSLAAVFFEHRKSRYRDGASWFCQPSLLMVPGNDGYQSITRPCDKSQNIRVRYSCQAGIGLKVIFPAGPGMFKRKNARSPVRRSTGGGVDFGGEAFRKFWGAAYSYCLMSSDYQNFHDRDSF